jgi:hypothetical protein
VDSAGSPGNTFEETKIKIDNIFTSIPIMFIVILQQTGLRQALMKMPPRKKESQPKTCG